MILRFCRLVLVFAVTLASSRPALAINAHDIPSDVPVTQLISSATAALAQGNAQDALTYFDVAIHRDPQNYLTIFRRGAAYLQLGKTSHASSDFDRALAIKPGFEAALVQRANIRSRQGDWAGARADFDAAGKKHGEDIANIDAAQHAERLSEEAEKQSDWEACTTHAEVAIQVASTAPGLRRRRAKCLFERGEFERGVSDLYHITVLSGSRDAYVQSSAILFFALGDTEQGMAQVSKCLRMDPDIQACSKLRKAEKRLDKTIKKIRTSMEKRRYNDAVKLLIASDDDIGLLKEIDEVDKEYRAAGILPATAPSNLHNTMVELTCESYVEMSNFKKANQFCIMALQNNPDSLHALIAKATRELDSDSFEAAIQTLNHAREHHQQSQKVQELLQKAQTLLKRSKQKDYYKTLEVSRDADAREIKRAYRKMATKYHPDKAKKLGMTTEEAQTKMTVINEAYEVLSDPELKARFDAGDDPNDQSQQGNPFQGSPFGGGQPVFFQQRGGGGGGGAHFKFQHGGFPGGFPF